MKVNAALVVVREVLKKEFPKPKRWNYLDSLEFYSASFKNWAATEIYMYLDEHRNLEPITAVEEFRMSMDGFACRAKTERSKFMFSTAYDVATYILDELLVAGGEYDCRIM